jgi:hypothetical protein
MTYDCKRKGTNELFAALDVATGEVIHATRRSHKATDVGAREPIGESPGQRWSRPAALGTNPDPSDRHRPTEMAQQHPSHAGQGTSLLRRGAL